MFLRSNFSSFGTTSSIARVVQRWFSWILPACEALQKRKSSENQTTSSRKNHFGAGMGEVTSRKTRGERRTRQDLLKLHINGATSAPLPPIRPQALHKTKPYASCANSRSSFLEFSSSSDTSIRPPHWHTTLRRTERLGTRTIRCGWSCGGAGVSKSQHSTAEMTGQDPRPPRCIRQWDETGKSAHKTEETIARR